MRSPQDKSQRTRGGFTLIELLVVISIIGVLSAMGAAAYFATIKRQQLNNTRAGMQAIEKMLMQHWQQVVDEAKKEEIPAAVHAWAANPNRAKVLWVKLRLMEAFPTTFAEIQNPNAAFWPYSSGLIPAGRRKHMYDYQKKISGTTPVVDESESSACLLLALSVARSGMKLDRDALGSAYFRDTNQDGIDEIVDGWGKTLRFYRFPTGSNALQAANPQKTGKGTKFADPADPDGLLFTWSGAGRTQFESTVHQIGSPNAWYVIPVLVSAGKDEQFGLNAAMSVTNATDAGDNIYSYDLKQ